MKIEVGVLRKNSLYKLSLRRLFMAKDKYKKAHGKLWYAINSGRLDNQKVKCERCGSTRQKAVKNKYGKK